MMYSDIYDNNVFGIILMHNILKSADNIWYNNIASISAGSHFVFNLWSSAAVNYDRISLLFSE